MLKRNWYFFIPVILIALPLLLTLWYAVNYGYGFDDAWKAVRYFGVSGTRYTQNYSETNFNRIRPGLDPRSVYEIMRMQPFERQNNDTKWIYSFPKASDSPYYHERVFIFERDKQNVPRVKSVVKRFHTPEVK